MTNRPLALCLCLLLIASFAAAHAQSWIDITDADALHLKAHFFESGPTPQCTCSDYQ